MSNPSPTTAAASEPAEVLPAAFVQFDWLRFIGLAILFYLVFLVVWWYTLDALTFAAGNIAGWLYGLFDPGTSISTHEKLVVFNVQAGKNTDFAGQARTTALNMGKITYGLPMFAAMASATRSRSWVGKLKAVALGVVVFVLLSIPAVMVWAKMLGLQLEDQIAAVSQGSSETRASFFYYAFHGYAFSQPVVAVALWLAIILLGLFKARPLPVKPPDPPPAKKRRK